MKIKITRILAAVALVGLARAVAPAASPSSSTQPSTLEIRAQTAFNNGQYAMALPMLEKLQGQFEGQTDMLGVLAEEVKVCQTQIAQANAVNGTNTGAPASAGGPPTASERKPHPAPKPGEVLDMQIKDLGNFDYDADKGGNIPADVTALTGATIKLHGFMIPIDQAESITQFALVPSLFACCFGQPPQVQHTIVCKAPAGKAVSYYPDELTVEGKLKVEEKKDDGFIVSIFEVDVTSVKPAAK
jgi:hypothetical protein